MILKIVLLCAIYFLCIDGEESIISAISGRYETKYDNIDLDELLKNDRLRKNYVKCLLNKGPCTPDALELKSNRTLTIDSIISIMFSHSKIFSLDSIPDAIATNCSKCTEKQRNGSVKVTHYLIDNQPEEWNQLATIYDKDGEYKRNYLDSKSSNQFAQPGTKTNDG